MHLKKHQETVHSDLKTKRLYDTCPRSGERRGAVLRRGTEYMSPVLQNMEKGGELDNVTPFVTNHGVTELLRNY
jgi:hypothetical protein